MDRLKKFHENLLRSVRLLMRQNLTSDTEERELESALSEKKQQLTEVESRIATLNAVSEKVIEIPSAEQVKTRLIDLSKILLTLVEGGSDGDRNQVHEVIKLLIGGRIYLSQKGDRKAQRGWLEGRFQTSRIAVLTEKITGVSSDGESHLQEVVIDFRKPEKDCEIMQQAWQLYQDGVMHVEIAKKLDCSRSNVTRLLKKASESFGVPFKDGRIRRSQLQKKQVKTPEYVVIAERAAELWKKGGSYLQIARECSCSDATAKKGIAYWYQSQDLEIPTVNSRRAEQIQKAKSLLEDGIPMQQIAKRLGTTMTSLRKWLKADFEAHGEELLDGRTRRWQKSG